MGIQETKGTGKASSSWARLIHRIPESSSGQAFEVNPLRCIKCGGNMRVVAFITDYQSSKKILKHIGEETIRPPPLRVQIPTANLLDTVTETSSAQAFGIPYLLWRHTSTACPDPELASGDSGIPGMPIKKSPKVLSEKCAQKQCAYPLCRWETRQDGSK